MKIIDALNSKEDLIIGSGVSDLKIQEAEESLGLSFSKDYKEYLSVAGLAMCCGHELTGLGKSERLDVVQVTFQMKSLHKDIPNDWYVIENENMDGAAMWQDVKGRVYFNTKKEFDCLADYILDM
ncbi:MAG: SMI1/KNR4 family protein [Hespellia sp.]|nr:SMI1/KNR4 family protein [Hespellia sp.]MDD3662963.1 SMI1/KNR4 family protein [Candidatus Paceibacterota bacterium]